MGRQRGQDGWVEKTGQKQTWKGHYYTYDTDGKRHHHSAILGSAKDKSKRDAIEALRKLIERETSVKIVPGVEAMTVEWYWKERFAPFRNWADCTRYAMENRFKNHVLPKIGKMRLVDVDRMTCQLLFRDLQVFSASMARTIRTYLNWMFEEALDEDFIRRNPMRLVESMPSKKESTGRYLTIEEIHRLMAELAPRDQLICKLSLVVGLRPGELFALGWKDFDPATGQLSINKSYHAGKWKPTKTKTSNAFVTLPPDIAQELVTWKACCDYTSMSPHIFAGATGNPIGMIEYLGRVLRPAAIRAGIMQPRPKGLPKGTVWVDKKTAVNFQAFRRTCATWLQKHGTVKDVQSHLRHSRPGTTMEYYIKEIPESVRSAVEGLNAAMFPKPASNLTM